MLIKTFSTLLAATALTACVAPTQYRESGVGGNSFGYASSKLADQVYRVRFIGSSRTPPRWGDAFVLYRSAQVAKEAGAPAFKIVEGTVDTTVLTGDDVFGQVNLHADVEVSQAVQQPRTEGDRIVGAGEPDMRRTAGSMPAARTPTPLFIYTPSGPGPAQAGRSILVELRFDLRNMDKQTFITEDVLGRLGPRIKRAEQARDMHAPRPERGGHHATA
jgi:hypothetical protein